MSDDDSRRTPIRDWHRDAGGRLVEFAGWELPVQYSGVLAEHRAVREAAGLFDVSHMGEIAVLGPKALELLQWLTPNDVGRLTQGGAQYSALLTPTATILDDLLVYRLDEEEFLLVVNAANTAADLAWIRQHAGDGVEVE
ncbi:MAG: glycine cleavage system aminomethyltransferase GcvT, partial [Acidobacteriota bacterium]|nr:glycine cleavage system aminomethyltransferase GcvT [Acidobacteriota bacterium]